MAAGEFETTVLQALSAMKRVLANGPAEIDDELLDIWVMTLAAAGLTAEDVRRAAGHVILTERFWPQPVVFLQAIRPPVNEDLEADRAWLNVRAIIRQVGGYGSLTAADVGGDGCALWAVEQIGWQRLCSELGDDNQNLVRAEFVRCYRLARADHSRADYVVGRLEADNRHRGQDLKPAYCGRPDWSSLPDVAPEHFRGRRALPEADEDEERELPADWEFPEEDAA